MTRILLLSFVLFCVNIYSQIKAPKDFIPLYGQHVTYYHQVEDYFAHLVQNSKQIKHINYGTTYEGRRLNGYFISSEDNLNQLDEIQKQHLELVNNKNASTNNNKVIVWLSFNVHGNEIGSIESAMNIAYQLLNTDNQEYQKWLKDIVVFLDPCLNPDGFAKYSHWLRNVSGSQLQPNVNDWEHIEPWPGSRQNHYLNDLNRDWAWQTQVETRQRVSLYHQWMPMVHADVHEMGYNEPYFFPPAVEPYHEQITAYQREFHNKIGALTSKKFDQKGWLYYSGERFDLFYPSYGDTYPTYLGAIGMTYEQGGIGAGRAVQMNNGQVLTIQDRIDHHTEAILSAVELSYIEKDRLLKNFKSYFSDNNLKGSYKSYVLKNSIKLPALLDVLDNNRILYQVANETKTLKGFSFTDSKELSFDLEKNDVVINTNQPRAVLTQILMEPYQKLTDSLTYDITAWSLPLAHGISCYGLKSDLRVNSTSKNKNQIKPLIDDNFYAVKISWGAVSSAKVLSQLHQQNIKIRVANNDSNIDNKKILKGDLIVAKIDNKDIEKLDQKLNDILSDFDYFELLSTGFSEGQPNLGGEYFTLLEQPKILMFGGAGVRNVDFGQIWHFLDERIAYPHVKSDIQNINRINLLDFNSIILPNGWYNLTQHQKELLYDFVNQGGKIIAMGGALGLFENEEKFSLKPFANDEDSNQSQKERKEEQLQKRFQKVASREREMVAYQVSGAIIKNSLDDSHPLSYGLGSSYFSLKTSSRLFQMLTDADNVVYIPKNVQSYGFVGSKIKSKLPETFTVATESVGKGQIIYMVDNPTFRGFWENGLLLFSNCLFF